MNIDAESVAVISLILRDAPQDRQFILCVLARSNQVPAQIRFHSNTEYPTFYGYANERLPFYLMGRGVICNVPGQGTAKRLISSVNLAYTETAINNAKNWDISQKLNFASKFINLDNKTSYSVAGVYLLFRDPSQTYIKEYVDQNKDKVSPFLDSKLGRFKFGENLLKQIEEQDKHTDLQRRYNQLLKEIRQPQQTSKTLLIPQKGNEITFSLIENVLNINGKQIKFKKDERPISMLKLLVKKRKGIYYGEVVKILEGEVNELKNPKNTYYDLCRGIANRLAKAGITEFILYDYNQAKINPDYKNLSK